MGDVSKSSQPAIYAPPPVPGGKSRGCGVCGKGRDDRLHIEGKAEADAETPKWG